MRVVILGTGTNVGKTYVTACLARSLTARASVLALKPVESGVALGETGDAGTIALAANHPPALSPWRLLRGVSPHLAAREQQMVLDVAAVASWVQEQERAARPRISLVETAGGAFSPLAPGATNVELAQALEPALWLLVAPDALGVLHDLTATLRALPRPPDAVLLSSARGHDASSGTNRTELMRLGICEVLEELPAGAQQCPNTARWLLDHTLDKSGAGSRA